MTLTYQYPVVYFYGDDEEDSEIVQKEDVYKRQE